MRQVHKEYKTISRQWTLDSCKLLKCVSDLAFEILIISKRNATRSIIISVGIFYQLELNCNTINYNLRVNSTMCRYLGKFSVIYDRYININDRTNKFINTIKGYVIAKINYTE